MNKSQLTPTLAILLIVFIVLLLIFMPAAAFFGLNTLFGLTIPLTFKTWLAYWALAVGFGGFRTVVKKS
jgi:hypothetical protein